MNQHDHEHEERCHRLLGSLSDYIDGDLREELCNQIEEHMSTCENCRVVVNTLQKTVELYEKTSEEPQLPIQVKERLFAKLDLKDYLSDRD